MKNERQLGLLWGGVAVLLLALSPLAGRIAATLPNCPLRAVIHVPCPTCGTSRSAVALSHLDVTGAFSVNPLAALGWIGLVGGGLVAGVSALLGKPIREPDWRLSRPARWLLVVTLLANWVYLVGVGV